MSVQGATKSQKTRRAIFQAAARIVRDKGEEQLTINNICKEAKISRGTFFYHFKSKDELMRYYIMERFDNYIVSQHRNGLDDNGNIFSQVVGLYSDYAVYCEKAGVKFIANYYTPKNKALDMNLTMGTLDKMNLLMRTTITNFDLAIKGGYVESNYSSFDLAQDCCSLVKGCIFEWAIQDGRFSLTDHIGHMLYCYFCSIITEKFIDEYSFVDPKLNICPPLRETV